MPTPGGVLGVHLAVWDLDHAVMGVAYAQTVSAFTMLQFLKQHLETIQNAHFRVEMVKVYHTILNFVCTSCREEKISSLVWTSESFSSDT